MKFNIPSNATAGQFPNSSNSLNYRLPVYGNSRGFSEAVEDLYAESFYSTSALPNDLTVAQGMLNIPIPRSIFNSYALFNYRGFYGGLSGDMSIYFRDQPNNLLTGGYNAHNLTVNKLIDFYNEYYPKIPYRPQDFLYLKYYRLIPVNHLITLRRFPMPVEDNIFNYSVRPDNQTQTSVDATQVAGVTAVTYLGESTENKLEDILNFSFGLNWKELTAEMEAIDTGDGGYTNQPFYSKLGGIGQAFVDTAKGVSPGEKFRRQNIATADGLGTTYANFVLGPVNVVDKTTIRDRGLKFQNDVKLTFEYELKSLNYVNPKLAMIDIISNMLTMTTNNAQFFGGGHRYYGSSGYVASQFGDINKLRSGDFSGYVKSIVSDVETGFKGLFGTSDGDFSIESILQGGLKAGKTLLGNVLGQFLGGQIGNMAGTQATKAFISSEPTGNWHLTVGNPLNPIVTMGNMYCDNATMSLGAGLGYDDFPMEIKFEVDVKHAKPRDKGDIENMFNAGNGRIYASARNEQDILNLAGQEVQVYGSLPNVGTTNLQGTQSGGIASSSPNANPPGDISPVGRASQNGTAATDNSEYVGNLVSLMIDS